MNLAPNVGTFQSRIFHHTGPTDECTLRGPGRPRTNPEISDVYAIGDVSGAHLNPAVTMGFWLSKRFPGRAVIPYVVSQVVGALLASGLMRSIFLTHASLGTTRPTGPAWQSFVLETVLTAMLMFVILAVSSGAKEKGLMAGIAVGGVIGLEALFAGPICGASMNPARSLAPAIVSGNLADLWIYLAAPLLGSAIGVVCCRMVHPPGCCAGCSTEDLE